MMAGKTAVVAALCILATVALSGCQRSVSALDTRLPPEPLPSTPLEPVAGSELQPLDPNGVPQQLPQGQEQIAGNPDLSGLDQTGGEQVAALDPAPQPAAEPISREGMAGTWTVATDNPECRIILAFTKWSGGYRAATRRCNSSELSSVSAWDVKDNRVVLVDANGNQVANLSSSGAERYDGSTSGGKRITFSR